MAKCDRCRQAEGRYSVKVAMNAFYIMCGKCRDYWKLKW